MLPKSFLSSLYSILPLRFASGVIFFCFYLVFIMHLIQETVCTQIQPNSECSRELNSGICPVPSQLFCFLSHVLKEMPQQILCTASKQSFAQNHNHGLQSEKLKSQNQFTTMRLQTAVRRPI